MTVPDNQEQVARRQRAERHRRKRLDALRYVLAFPRSLWYNLRLLPFSQAVRMPILISCRTVVENCSGKVSLHVAKPRMGLVKIGFHTCQCSDYRHDRTRINLRGQLHIAGACALGAGCRVEVTERGTLTLGDRFNLGSCSLVVCHCSISFGTNVLTSWNCTLMDTDQHWLVDGEGAHCNPDRPVVIGDNVWLGCHVLVPKGVTLPAYTVVGAGSVLRGAYEEQHTVVAGNPAVVVRRGVDWNGR